MSEAFPLPKQPSMVKKVLTSRLNLSALGVFIVFLICVAYIITNVLGGPLFGSAKVIKVDLSATGGLYVGAPVSYRGVNVGRVKDIQLTPNGVEAKAEILSGTPIPADTVAAVKSLSPVGEQYLDFEPRTSAGPTLQDGATVAGVGNTVVPETLAQTVISISKLLDQINPQQVQTILDESNTALAGTSDDLGRLADQGNQLINDLNTTWPNLNNLLHNGGTLLQLGAQFAPQIIQSAQDFRAFAAFLKAYSPELQSLLANAPGYMQQIEAILNDIHTVLPEFANVGGQVFHLLASYNPHLRALLANFPGGLGAIVGTIQHGALQMSLIGQRDDLCNYGTTVHPPTTAPTTFQTNGSCSAGVPYLQRGAAHAPGPVAAP